MKNSKSYTLAISIRILLLLLIPLTTLADEPVWDDEYDKCGLLDHALSKLSLQLLGEHWGYGYDSLLVDLDRWALSPYVQIDSLGISVQGRTLWELAITGPDSTSITDKQVLYVHARTHPNEVQGWWVTNEMINILLAENELGRHLRDHLIVYIIPMYNPDGVELEYNRQNANNVDIESNWYSSAPEPEVQVLRARFIELMNSGTPVDVALNMHSAWGEKRFFVCHDPAGTSDLFFQMEQRYIAGVRSHFPHGIEPWDYSVTWTSGTPLRYPESWWWLNHHEAVMALTYEDMNSSLATSFDTTAFALLNGSYEYIFGNPVGIDHSILDLTPTRARLVANYPNPFNNSTQISFIVEQASHVELSVYSMKGVKVASLQNAYTPSGHHKVGWQAVDAQGVPLPTGIYICQLKLNSYPHDMTRMLLLK